MTLKLHVLGSAAGGGFPQWNCNCPQCVSVRTNKPGFSPRTQSSIAVSADGRSFALINASPDIRSQLLGNPVVQPAQALRDSAISGVVLIDAQIDHVTGLLFLRESTRPLHLYCTDRVHEDLTRHFPIIPMLDHYCGVIWHEIFADGRSFRVIGTHGIEFSAVALQSKPPPYSPHRREPQRGDNLGLLIGDLNTGHRAFYAPGLGQADLSVTSAMAQSQVILVDGTCWTDDELVRHGIGTQSAMEMGHIAQCGSGGMIELLGQFPDKRRILIHINNTNPILDESGAERAELSRMGIDVARDGQIIEV